MVPPLIIPTSTCNGYTLSTDVQRIVALWRTEYERARQEDNPITAILTATLSTASTWRWLR